MGQLHVLVASVELHIPTAASLKAKRSALVPVIRHIDRRSGVGAAEVGYNDKWQRARIGVSVVGASVTRLEEEMDAIERYLWSRPDVEVVDVTRTWVADD